MKYIYLFLACLIPTLSSAATIDEQKETTGYGETYQEALSSALLEAVRQVRGLEVGTEKALKTIIIQSTGSQGHTLVGKEEIASDIYTKSKGSIKTYEVIETHKPTKKGAPWQVVTLVTVPVYKESMRNDTRRTIAVLPFEILSTRITTYQANLALSNITERIADTITSELNQSRKFAVLNRSFEKQFGKERMLIGSDKVSSAEAGRLGRKLGADFIVLGKIYQLSFNKNSADHYGMSSNQIEARINLFYTVIEAATEKVMWSDTLTYKHKSSNEDEVTAQFISGLSSMIVTNILDVIYPVKIMKLSGEQYILLNQGGKRLKEGLIMEVYSAGESIPDPDTGMLIKTDGEKVAELEVTQVKPKYSIAKLRPESGNYSNLKLNAITRRANTRLSAAKMEERELTPGSSDKPLNW
ncbi:MAG: CsgG/HfaB family protein [Gammaproteobacteria bacterium]|nr:CsgG/HfaB family protein [Gammaproteobacteria bacterium]